MAIFEPTNPQLPVISIFIVKINILLIEKINKLMLSIIVPVRNESENLNEVFNYFTQNLQIVD